MQNILLKKESYAHIEYLLIAILIILPMLTFAGYQLTNLEAYDEWRIFEIIQLIILIAFLTLKKNLIYYLFSNTTPPKKLIFTIVIFLSIVSCIHSIYPLRALSDFLLLLSLTIALLPLSYIFSKNEKTREIIIVIFTLSHILFIINLITQIITAFATNDFETIKSCYAQFYIGRMYGDIMLVILPLMYATITLVPKKHSPLIYLYLIISHTLLFLSGGRAQLLSLILSTIIIYTLSKSYRTPIKKYAILISASFLFYFMIAASSGYGELARTDSSGRVHIYLIALHTSLDHIFLGIGGDHFSTVNGVTGTSADFSVAHPHNLPLQIMTEYGWPVFIFILILLTSVIKTWLTTVARLPESSNNNASNIYVFLSISLLGSIFNSFLSGNHVYPLSQLSIFMIISLICSYHLSYNTVNIECPKKKSLVYISIALRLTTAIFLCSFIYLSYSRYDCHQYATSKQTNFVETINPRFWFIGQASFEKICYDRQH